VGNNQNKEREDQAEELRRLVYDVEHDREEESIHTAGEEKETREIDILNLPPRKEVHGKKQNPVKLKTSTSFKRLLLVAVILIIVLWSIYFLYGDNLIQIFNS
jgi:hypothetical protein